MRRRRFALVLLLVLLLSAAGAMALLSSPFGSGPQGNFAFLPTELLSIFKKPDTPTGNHPQQTPNSLAGRQPFDMPDMADLPADVPTIEVADNSDIPNDPDALIPTGSQTHRARGGSGNSQSTRTTSNGGDSGGGWSGGGGGGSGGGGSGGASNPTRASLVAPKDDKKDEDDAANDDGDRNQADDGDDDNDDSNDDGDDDQTADNDGDLPDGPGDPLCGEITTNLLAATDTECSDQANSDDPNNGDTPTGPAVTVDEPAPLSLLLIGALGLLLARRLRRKGA